MRLLPLLGAVVSAVVLIVAAGRYPGGYDWVNQSVSSLFQPLARDGAVNGARLLASAAVVLFCTSMAFVFASVAEQGPTRAHRKVAQIAGIGSMVYAALVVTPMHDVLVGVALVFFVTAVVTIVHGLHARRRRATAGAGLLCLALVLCNASMYYGDWLYGFLPAVQKASIVLWASWLFWVDASGAPRESTQQTAPA